MRKGISTRIFRWLHLICIVNAACVEAKEPELPLCPPNIQYFPQNLPMHCRMPGNADGKYPPQGKPQNGLPFPMPPMPGLPGLPMPFPGIPGFPGSSGLPGYPGLPVPASGPLAAPMPVSMSGPGSAPMPGVMPGVMPGAMPGAMPAQPHKLPVIVMPFYSQDRSYTKKEHGKKNQKHEVYNRLYKHRDDNDETSENDASSDDTSSDFEGWWRRSNNGRRRRNHSRRKHKQRPSMLTPVLQYVTKDGYVIYEKKISDGEAKDWLHNNDPTTEAHNDRQESNEQSDLQEETVKKVEKKNLEVKPEMARKQVKKRVRKS